MFVSCRYSDYVRTESGLQYQVSLYFLQRPMQILCSYYICLGSRFLTPCVLTSLCRCINLDVVALKTICCITNLIKTCTLQDIREGQGESPSEGSDVSIDWDGYTIGYYVSVLFNALLQRHWVVQLNMGECFGYDERWNILHETHV